MLDVLDSPITKLAQEAERKRIARDLHDSVVQSLTALVADLEYFRAYGPTADQQLAQKVEVWQELARESLISMREALGGLRGAGELHQGLEAAIRALLDEMDGYQVVFECEDWPALLPFEYTSNIYYMVREALVNIRKHAQASMVRVSMFSFEGSLYISVTDNGIGMPSQLPQGGCGYQQGLIGLRERAELLGGHLCVESEPGRGTRLDIAIPLFSA
jgi:signal transduction histidine kinase